MISQKLFACQYNENKKGHYFFIIYAKLHFAAQNSFEMPHQQLKKENNRKDCFLLLWKREKKTIEFDLPGFN